MERRQPTEQQRVVIEDKKGLFVVRACPGSGKTFSVAARFHRLLSDWEQANQGIAAISFTNVAWTEIQEYLAAEFRVSKISYPHFLGTIDSFINRFIFLPFGHLAMKCDTRPTLWGPPHNTREPIGDFLFWRQAACNKKCCRLNDFTYDLNGNVVGLKADKRGQNCTESKKPCIGYKKNFSSKGNATQSDANYWALEVLRSFPGIAAAIARRFPLMMVDEAQDTSSVQMAIIDELVKSGLNELMLVGDPDQAIYEWREAEPQLFISKSEKWAQNSVLLTENWRSSQTICDVTSKMSSAREPMTAVNPHLAAVNIGPKVFGYQDTAELPELARKFAENCRCLGVESADTHVLTRGRDFLNAIVPGTTPVRADPWVDDAPLTPNIARAKYLLDNGRLREANHVWEQVVPDPGHSPKRAVFVSGQEFAARGQHYALLRAMPATTGTTLGTWAVEASQYFANTSVLSHVAIRIKRKSNVCDYASLKFGDVFGHPADEDVTGEFCLGTVHAVKGQSLEAVLLVLKNKPPSSKAYPKLIVEATLGSTEELRIVYVGLTRAQRVLSLAVPFSDVDAWTAYLSL